MMALCFQTLGVLLALVAPGYTLSCMECFSKSESCSGPSVTCDSGFLCGAMYTEQTIDGVISEMNIAMSCISQDMCGISTSSSRLFERLYKTSISCCSTDNCTPNPTPFPKDSSVPYGGTTLCHISGNSTTSSFKCTGDEKMEL